MDVAIRDATVAAAVGDGSVLDALPEIGVRSIEIEVDHYGQAPRLISPTGQPFSVKDAKRLQPLKRVLEERGVRVSALLLETDFSGEHADGHIGSLWRAMHVAATLGAPVVRIDPLARDRTIEPPRVRDNVIRCVRQLISELFPEFEIELGLENHGPIANDPRLLDEILDGIDHPRVGLTLDTGNFYWYGFPLDEVYQLIERYAPRTKHTHIKSINYPPDAANRRREVGYEYKQYCCSLDEGNLDLRRVVRILRGAGYDRDLCIENESLFKHPPEQRLEVLKRDVVALRAALA